MAGTFVPHQAAAGGAEYAVSTKVATYVNQQKVDQQVRTYIRTYKCVLS